ncbi:unnamed protein product [Porites evermanni]|uniref:Fanconi Anaemia group E protein C-terminal domain-containing protein n=1 Tax=Porites evermanni TaxID=104178 RepID=A0ABN8SND9_9CNID|nr:unnamed protein product [Porites evermanni]
MADEACSSSRKENHVDFPPVCLLNTLVRSFTKEWRGVFAALNSECFPVQAASIWLQKRIATESLSDIPPSWEDFMDDLAKDFPVVLNDQLFFKPKLLLLPLNIQRNTLAFISYHGCSVPANSLHKLIHSLRKFEAEMADWRLTHLKILESKLRNFKETDRRDWKDGEESHQKENKCLFTNLITIDSKTRFEDLINKTKKAESSIHIPWLNNFIKNEVKDADVSIDKNISKEQDTVSPQRIESCAGDEIDMIDLTDICDGNICVDVPSHKTLQKLHPEPSALSGESDIEIIQVFNSHKVKVEPETIDMKDLTVPPPPECLIIENEDVLEHSIEENFNFSFENIPGHSVTKTETDREQSITMSTENVPELLIEKNNVSAESKLPDALQLKVTALKNLLQNLETNEFNFHDELEVFSASSPEELRHICAQLNLKNLEESLAISLCQQFVSLSSEPSFSNAVIFAVHCLLPKIQQLKQTASRVLFAAVNQFAKKHSRPFCDGVILTLVQQSNLDTPQVDLVNKVIKECLTEDTTVYLMQLIFSVKSDVEGLPFMWTESTVSVVQVLIDLKPEFNEDLFGSFVCVLEQQSQHLTKSLKFSKMLLAVIKTYGQHVSMHQNTFVYILEVNETFLKKAGLTALKRFINS